MANDTANVVEQAQELLPDEMRDKLDEVREELMDIDERVRQVVREHPFMTVFGALAGGYILGRFIARL